MLGGGVTPLQATRAWRSLLRAAARLLLWTTLWERLLWEPTSCFLFEPWTLNASFSGCCFGQKNLQKNPRTSTRCHGAVSDGPQSPSPFHTSTQLLLSFSLWRHSCLCEDMLSWSSKPPKYLQQGNQCLFLNSPSLKVFPLKNAVFFLLRTSYGQIYI